MVTNNDDNFDDIDLNELFNDFNEKPKPLLPKYEAKSKTNQDDLFEFTENDCTAPRINRRRIKAKRKINNNNNSSTQMTMYDYASSISYKHKHFYSSLDNTTTTKTIIKGPKRSLPESSQRSKKSKTDPYDKFTPSSSSSPDFIDNLLQYLDQRSRTISEQESSKSNEIKQAKN